MLRRSALVGVLSVLAPAIAAKTQSPQDFLRTIYEPYKSADFVGQPYWEVGRYFVADLAHAIERDLYEARVRDLAPQLDADPFVDAQDWKIDAVSYSSARSGNNAVGSVAFVSYGQARGVVLALELTPQSWRVKDITGSHGSLRGLYKLA